MNVLLVVVLAGIGFVFAHHTYGRWLAQRIFDLSDTAVCPSKSQEDGIDYVPTHRQVVFGHHFTSIAGTGPIVGPAIAVIWGWLPAVIWIVFGSIFVGAVHDLGSLVVSLRNRGQSLGDVAGKVLNRRVRILFLCILFLALTIIIAIFGLVIAAVFRQFPAAIVPCLAQIPLAMIIGLWLHRKGRSLLPPSIIALALMYLTVVYGNSNFGFSFLGWQAGEWGLGSINSWFAEWPTLIWVIVLLAYAYFASVLPVWTLLQPRDYINALQLISALAMVVAGIVVAAFIGGAPMGESALRPPLEFNAPLMQWNPAGAPLIFPFLFITIACGAISGFHCMVSSGTSSKQLKRETDAQFVGYGAMLTEAFLALIVVAACVAGLGLGIVNIEGNILLGAEAWESHYASWSTAGGLASTVGAFVTGAGNFLSAIGVSPAIGIAIMGVFVASFAATTLDTATRLQRYVIQELAASATVPVTGPHSNPLTRLMGCFRGRHAAALTAVIIAGALASLPAPAAEAWTFHSAGGGGLILWPLFGATNQLLGGFAFVVIAFWLWQRQKPVALVIIPLIFMLIMPAWAMIWQVFVEAPGQSSSWLQDGNWLLIVVAIITISLEIWMLTEAWFLYHKYPHTRRIRQI